jgi:hypothetical protein
VETPTLCCDGATHPWNLLLQQRLALFGQAANNPIFDSDDTVLYVHTMDLLLLSLKRWG